MVVENRSIRKQKFLEMDGFCIQSCSAEIAATIDIFVQELSKLVIQKVSAIRAHNTPIEICGIPSPYDPDSLVEVYLLASEQPRTLQR